MTRLVACTGNPSYERDALLRSVIERAVRRVRVCVCIHLDTRPHRSSPASCVFVQGFTDLVESEQARDEGRQQQRQLATIPQELAHLSLENFRDRPVKAELTELLLLQKEDERFATCLLIHGMGGTGKTVTAVAVLQEVSIRRHFYSIYWLTVGADAVGDKFLQLMGALHRQLSGKSTDSKEVVLKSKQEWRAILVDAMVDKPRALVVLDDPWMPEQVRFLNPFDGSQTDHRLLVTTRIRDLVPKAIRLELPLMDRDEAVVLLLELADVKEATYRKEQPGSSWPPEAAYEIVAECGLLPITLTIAAQVVRSWGQVSGLQ